MTISQQNDRIDVLFINPSIDWKMEQNLKINARIEDSIPNQETPHIGIAYLLAKAKAEGWKAKYIDMVMDGFSVDLLLDFIIKTKPALIGFTALTVDIFVAAGIAKAIKQEVPEAKICVGGVHVTAMPLETLKEFSVFDFVVCGEAEEILIPMLNYLDDRRALSCICGVVTHEKQKFQTKRIKDLDDSPFPAWEEFDLSKYPGTYPHRTKSELPILVGRGCPYQCVFCCRSLGSRVRQRSVLSVINEIERNVKNFNCQSIAFLDETFLINMTWFHEFLDILMKRGLNKRITWSCSTRVDNMSLGLLKKMKTAGCYYVFFGMESADDQTLRVIKKNITVEQIKNAVKHTKQVGILPVGAFIIGLPGDTEEKILKAIKLARELDLYSVTFPIAVPFPGTELRAMALKGEFGMRITSNNWNLYGKQDPGVLESQDLPFARRKELQQLAYLQNPKKKITDYLDRLSKNVL